MGAPREDSSTKSIKNGVSAAADDNAQDAGAVCVYRNNGRIFDPDVFVSDRTQTSITFRWGSNLGVAGARVIVAPAGAGTNAASACQLGGGNGSVTLTAGVTSYTCGSLTANTKYGFRFCSTDDSNVTDGSTLWFDTAP